MLPLLLPLCLLALVHAQVSNNDPSGKALFVAEPTCSTYQCTAIWETGTTNLVQWLNPTSGNVSIQLIARANTSLFYVLADSTFASTPCTNNTSGLGCGERQVTLGAGWPLGNYDSVVVTSLDNAYTQGYSDVVALEQGPPSTSTSASAGSSMLPSTSPAASVSSTVALPSSSDSSRSADAPKIVYLALAILAFLFA